MIASNAPSAQPTFAPRIFWIDWIKTYAVLTIILHHWLGFLGTSNFEVINKVIDLVATITGNSIHLFFIASGIGLANSFLSKSLPLSEWYKRRLSKIVLPFWIALLLTFIAVNCVHHFNPSYVKIHLSFKALFHNLIFIRNFSEDASAFNYSLWFIPNIVGLYLVFPLLALLQQKTKPAVFLGVTFAISNLSMLAFTLCGQSLNNRHSVFLFFVFQFAFGMSIGQHFLNKNLENHKKTIFPFIVAGLIFYTFSLVLTSAVSWGGGFNKPFTALGIFFIILALIYTVHLHITFIDGICKKISNASYYMYLIHFPLVYYFLMPFSRCFPENFVIRVMVFLLTFITFSLVVYALSRCFDAFGRSIVGVFTNHTLKK